MTPSNALSQHPTSVRSSSEFEPIHPPDTIFYALDPVGSGLTVLSGDCKQVLGVDGEKLKRGMSLLIRYTFPHDRFRLMNELDSAVLDGGKFEQTFRWRRPSDGKLIWLTTKASLASSHNGEKRLVGVLFRLNDALLEPVRLTLRSPALQRFFEQLPWPCIGLNRACEIEFSSRSAAVLFSKIPLSSSGDALPSVGENLIEHLGDEAGQEFSRAVKLLFSDQAAKRIPLSAPLAPLELFRLGVEDGETAALLYKPVSEEPSRDEDGNGAARDLLQLVETAAHLSPSTPTGSLLPAFQEISRSFLSRSPERREPPKTEGLGTLLFRFIETLPGRDSEPIRYTLSIHDSPLSILQSCYLKELFQLLSTVFSQPTLSVSSVEVSSKGTDERSGDESWLNLLFELHPLEELNRAALDERTAVFPAGFLSSDARDGTLSIQVSDPEVLFALSSGARKEVAASPSLFVLDDSTAVNRVLEKASAVHGITCCFAQTIEEADHLLEGFQSQPTCFLVEAVAKFDRVLAYSEELSRSYPTSRIVVLTRSPEFANRAEDRGIFDLVLKKPCSPERIFHFVQDSLDQQDDR